LDSREFTVQNNNGISMTVSSYGARLIELLVPDRSGTQDNVVLGFDAVSSYKQHPNLYLGATIGRVAGRIKDGRFLSPRMDFQVDRNEGKHHLHGGSHRSFDRVEWAASDVQSSLGAGVRFNYSSPHLEEGYPGNLHAQADYIVSEENEVWTVFRATTDRPTPVNMTNHSYWNLASGNGAVVDHQLMINAESVLVTDADLIPTGAVTPVENSPLDYRRHRRIADNLPAPGTEPWPGLDHSYLLSESDGNLRLAAALYDAESGRSMEVLTTETSLQVYSANRLPNLPGRNDSVIAAGRALCLEPQRIPDSKSLPGFPSIVLMPGDEYLHSSCYRFRIR
jgi:aldose 1-epimerase